jgi:tetratricopeptide (TPR) repeat protein
MAKIQSSKNTLDTTLFDGITMVSVLLRTGYHTEAASLASQLLVHFPQALPLHIGAGRALMASTGQGVSTQRALGHLRRVLDSDPENWRIRLETVLLYLRGDRAQRQRAGEELWIAVQSAPDNPWLREMIDRLPDQSIFKRTQKWNSSVARGFNVNSLNVTTEQQNQDEGGVARLYLRRKMPWMAVEYFEKAARRLPENVSASRIDLRSGLLLALWQNGEAKRASALASDMLLDQPQLILPRLILTAHLASAALKNHPEALKRLIEPVWKLDPFLVRASEIAYSAGVDLPPSLWPRPVQGSNLLGEGRGASNWQNLPSTTLEQISLKLGDIDQDWLNDLLEASHKQEVEAVARGGMQRMWHPHSEVSFSLSELDGLLVDVTPAAMADALSGSSHLPDTELIMPKGRPFSPSGPPDTELEGIAQSIAAVENLLYGTGRPKRPRANSKARRPQAGSYKRKPGRRVRKGGEDIELESPENETNEGFREGVSLESYIPAPTRLPQANADEDRNWAVRQATALIVSSEQALTSKYGADGFNRVHVLLQQLLEVMREHGSDARLLLVDSTEALRRNGFTKLDPVHADNPEQIRDLINTALPGEVLDTSGSYPNTVFIIGGPDIIPFWKLPNPSFDSDKEVLSDNPYGSRDQTYLLPERIVGRLPDDGSSDGAPDINFLLSRLNEVIQRQRARNLPHSGISNFPMRIFESIMPQSMRFRAGAADGIQFEQEWLRSTLASGEVFLDKSHAVQLAPFFYSAEAWKLSTETLRTCMSGNSNIVFSPPTRSENFDASWLQKPRLLHFNLHGFRDTGNWYGQSSYSKIVANPTLSSLPMAFTPAQASQVRSPGTVVFSEACYGGYLPGKGVNESVALSFLEKGTAAFVGSTAISYGSAGPELCCAGHLSYYFWKEILKNGSSFGRALQAAKLNYARERLAVGHNLSGDDAKTLLEFILLGDPTIGLRSVSPHYFTPAADMLGVGGQLTGGLQKGGLFRNGQTFEQEWEEDRKLRGVTKGLWGRFAQPKEQYKSVPYENLPDELTDKVEKILEWLLPDSPAPDGKYLQALVDMGAGYQDSRRTEKKYKFLRHQKGGDPSPEAGNGAAGPFEGVFGNEEGQAQVVLSGHRTIQTDDGREYDQTFHLNTDITGSEIIVSLSRGKG